MRKKIYYASLTFAFFTTAICRAEVGACFIKLYDRGGEDIRCDDRITEGQCRILVKDINNEFKKDAAYRDKQHSRSGATLIGFIPGGTCP